jgi:hypothetical protein
MECGKEKMWKCYYFLFEKKILKRYLCSAQYRDAERTKEIKKNWDNSVEACQENLSA